MWKRLKKNLKSTNPYGFLHLEHCLAHSCSQRNPKSEGTKKPKNPFEGCSSEILQFELGEKDDIKVEMVHLRRDGESPPIYGNFLSVLWERDIVPTKFRGI